MYDYNEGFTAFVNISGKKAKSFPIEDTNNTMKTVSSLCLCRPDLAPTYQFSNSPAPRGLLRASISSRLCCFEIAVRCRGALLSFDKCSSMQTRGDAAASQLILYHYPELKEEKGIVLMTAEMDSTFLVRLSNCLSEFTE